MYVGVSCTLVSTDLALLRKLIHHLTLHLRQHGRGLLGYRRITPLERIFGHLLQRALQARRV